jgi:N-acetylglucosamine repressor
VVNWSWGIGLGVIVNGKVYNGSNGFAGELSHMKLVEQGNLCVCGKRGCLETLASAQVVVNEAVKGIMEGKVSQLTERFRSNPKELTLLDVIAAARLGDEFSIRILHQVGLAMGRGLAVTMQLLNPGIIVLGGPMATANQFVLNPIQQSLNRHCLENIVVNTRIVVSGLFEQSGLLGVSAMMYEKLFSVSGRN